MIVGIVGNEAAKFTALGENRACMAILDLLSGPTVTEVVSGACHLGGVDKWAAELGEFLGLKVTEFPPKSLSWEDGYKPRNLQIANRSTAVYCIVVDQLPGNYTGMRFQSCYHCGKNDHIKSGGCWTVREAIKLGKVGEIRIVNNY